jgi:hypothetical protein
LNFLNISTSTITPQKYDSGCACFSAGVGRTGVFITLSIVLERMQYEAVVDLFQTVRILRTQRPAMVQTEVNGHILIQELRTGVRDPVVNSSYIGVDALTTVTVRSTVFWGVTPCS